MSGNKLLQCSAIYRWFHGGCSYEQQKTYFVQKAKIVMVNEIKRTICIILYMDISKLPNQRIYWGSRPAVPIISKSMSRDRFEDILSILHFSDNKKVVAEGQDGHNNCTRYNR